MNGRRNYRHSLLEEGFQSSFLEGNPHSNVSIVQDIDLRVRFDRHFEDGKLRKGVV